VVQRLGSPRIHILDTKPDLKKPKIVKAIEPDEVAAKAGLYATAHRALRSRRDIREGWMVKLDANPNGVSRRRQRAAGAPNAKR